MAIEKGKETDTDTSSSPSIQLDLTDVDHRVGKPVGGGQLCNPCTSSDIRRWVMAMDYPNPLHWDEQFAHDSKYGGIVAPQSIAVALDYGHGGRRRASAIFRTAI